MQPIRAKCPGPFHQKQYFSYRQEMEEGHKDCYSMSNAFHPVSDGTAILMQWGACNDTEGEGVICHSVWWHSYPDAVGSV